MLNAVVQKLHGEQSFPCPRRAANETSTANGEPTMANVIEALDHRPYFLDS